MQNTEVLSKLFVTGFVSLSFVMGLSACSSFESGLAAVSSSAASATRSIASVSSASPKQNSYGPFALNPGQSVVFNDLTLVFQADGNLVLYRNLASSNRSVLWNTVTSGRNCASGCIAQFQGDGNLVLYQNGQAYWNSQSYGLSNPSLQLSDIAPFISIQTNGQTYWSASSNLNWFTALYDMNPDGSWPGVSDFMSLFNSSQSSEAMAHIQVLKLYTATVLYASDADLITIFSYLQSHNIALAIEFGGVTAGQNCGVQEGYALNSSLVPLDGPTLAVTVANRIASLGGTLAYVAMDEPMYWAHYGDNFGSAPAVSCQFSISDLAANVARNYNAFRTVFPAVSMGDIEPVGIYPSATWLNDNNLWLDAFKAATGVPLAFFHDDAPMENPQWQARIPQLLPYLAGKNIAYGLIRNGCSTSAGASSSIWVGCAISRFGLYDSLGLPAPAQNIFQSWDPYPVTVLPETSPTTLTYVVDQFFGVSVTSVPLQANQMTGSFRAGGGYYFSAFGGGGSTMTVAASVPSTWETFLLSDLSGASFSSGDQITIQAQNGDYVSAQCGGGTNSNPVCGTIQVNRAAASTWEEFTLIKVGGSAGSQLNPGDTFNLMSSGGFYCTAEGNGGAGSVMTCNRAVASTWETFTFQ